MIKIIIALWMLTILSGCVSDKSDNNKAMDACIAKGGVPVFNFNGFISGCVFPVVTK